VAQPLQQRIPSKKALGRMLDALNEQERIEREMANDHKKLVAARKAWSVKYSDVLVDLEIFKRHLRTVDDYPGYTDSRKRDRLPR
jgi:hypothetical protein